MEQRGNDHVDWWAVSVKQRREIERLRTMLNERDAEIGRLNAEIKGLREEIGYLEASVEMAIRG
jgi:hypothetical protein